MLHANIFYGEDEISIDSLPVLLSFYAILDLPFIFPLK